MLNKSLGFKLEELEKITATDSPYIHSKEIVDWESLSDEELFGKVIFEGSRCFDMSGGIFAVTDISYLKKEGAFFFDCEKSSEFFRDYFQRFGECFFNGDVCFILPEVNKLILFQHNGFILFYETPPGFVDS